MYREDSWASLARGSVYSRSAIPTPGRKFTCRVHQRFSDRRQEPCDTLATQNRRGKVAIIKGIRKCSNYILGRLFGSNVKMFCSSPKRPRCLAAIHSSIVAYCGRYELVCQALIIAMDFSWLTSSAFRLKQSHNNTKFLYSKITQRGIDKPYIRFNIPNIGAFLQFLKVGLQGTRSWFVAHF